MKNYFEVVEFPRYGERKIRSPTTEDRELQKVEIDTQ